jgi:Sulfotransferase family
VLHKSHATQVPYPTLYHFSHPNPLPESFPSFVVGRNPYIRLLSGFLDKMTLPPVRTTSHDWHTHAAQNRAMGLVEGEVHEDSALGFKRFVTLMATAVRGGVRQNQHFEAGAQVCRVEEMPYHFALRLEDTAKWLPCLEDGLGIGHMTERGWAYERIHFSDWHAKGNQGCFWAPPDTDCAAFYAATRGADGRRVPWEVAAAAAGGGGSGNGGGGNGSALKALDTARDPHATSADKKWRDYYDQETGDLVHELMRADFDLWGYARESFPA